MIGPSIQLDLFPVTLEPTVETDGEYQSGWTLDPVLMRFYRLRWVRGIEVVEVVGGYL